MNQTSTGYLRVPKGFIKAFRPTLFFIKSLLWQPWVIVFVSILYFNSYPADDSQNLYGVSLSKDIDNSQVKTPGWNFQGWIPKLTVEFILNTPENTDIILSQGVAEESLRYLLHSLRAPPTLV